MIREDIGPTHYRLRDCLTNIGVTVSIERFKVIKLTPQGCWVVSEYSPLWLTPEDLIKRKYAKWVSGVSHKRYCYPTMEQAVASFKRRKEVQLSKLEHQLAQVKFVVEKMVALSDYPDAYRPYGLNLGMPEEFQGYFFY